MRLACESCAAAYIIDDGAMTSRGVRAQCPRCKSIQDVPAPQDARLTPNPQARVRAFGPPIPGREPEPEPPTQVARVALTTRMVARPPTPPPEALLKEGHEAHAELFGELDWNESELADGHPPASVDALPPPPRPFVPMSPVSSSPAQLLAVAAPAAVDGNEKAVLFGSAGEHALPEEESLPSELTCASCGGALTSFEDVPSGMCTSCRAAAAARPVPPPSVETWATFESTPPAVRAPTPPPRRTPAVPQPPLPPRRRWGTLVALAVVVLLGGASLLWLRARRGTPLHVQPPPAARRVDPLGKLPTGLAERLASWKAADTGPHALSRTVLVEAQREIALDQPAAYASAQKQLQQ